MESLSQNHRVGPGFAEFADLHRIVMVCNPDNDDAHFKSLDTNQDVVSVDGQSYWSDVLNDPWQFLEKP